MSRRITAEERIEEIFIAADEPQAARLLAIGQTITKMRFPHPELLKKRAKRSKPKPETKRDPANGGLDLRHAGSPQ